MSLVTQLKKGILELCILSLIGQKSVYGYDLIEKLKDLGLIVSEGTLYPILSRLRQEGLVLTTVKESTMGPSRRYYQLSEKGRTYCAEGQAEVQSFIATITPILLTTPKKAAKK